MVKLQAVTALFLALISLSSALSLSNINRRRFIGGLASSPFQIAANSAQASTDEVFVKTTADFSYAISPPPSFDVTNKPLKTHLEEVNFVSSSTKGYQFGVTVDPVRINSLKEFGTPEEVAARVVVAEVNRDGVFDVTLVNDPVETNGSYLLNYLSQGKRGDKHFVCKIEVLKNKLYVLTAQAKEENYADVKDELMATVNSFRAVE